MKQLANYIVLGVAYEHCLRMNAKRAGLTRETFRPIDFLRSIAQRRGVPLRWTVLTQMEILPYLAERLQPGRLTLPEGYELGDRVAPPEEPKQTMSDFTRIKGFAAAYERETGEALEEPAPHIRGNQSGYVP